MRAAWWAVALVFAFGCVEPSTPDAGIIDAGPPRLEVTDALDGGAVELTFGMTRWVEQVATVRWAPESAPRSSAVTVRAAPPACVVLGTSCVETFRLDLESSLARQVTVRMPVSLLGVIERTITFSSDELGVTPATSRFSALGLEAPDCLTLEPPSIDFGPLNPGCPVRFRALTLTNQCFRGRLLGSPWLDPEPEPFAVSSQVTLPRRIEPGTQWSAAVQFLGGAPGRHTASLELPLDGRLGFRVPLTGVRTEVEPRQWYFSASRDLDVLVVVDASADFEPWRGSVKARAVADLTNFNFFPGRLRVGVVGVGETGVTAVDDTVANFDLALDAAFSGAPVDGGSVERCIDTAAGLVGSPFWRPDSRRAAVCITDAPEQSADVPGALQRLLDAGIRWDVVGPPSSADAGCQVEGLEDGVHSAAVDAGMGSLQSICGVWRMPPLFPPGRGDEFTLPVVPLFPITVFVDGVRVPEDSWTWHAMSRTLLLRSPALSSVLIRESVACEP